VPWEHCDRSISDDEPQCPVCGANKAQWTVGFDRTRLFQLSGKDDPDQAGSLEEASDSGSPFCEDCQAQDNPPQEEPAEEEEEEQQQDQQQPPPSEPEPDPVTEEEQAETLSDAADSGSPFCEQCQAQDNPGEAA